MRFQDYQRAFTARIRAPRTHPRPPGAPAERMKVYEELLYNNVAGVLEGCFPVCRKILGARRWTRLVRGFFRDHASRSPFLRQVPGEFLKYLRDEWPGDSDYPAFLLELAHYEWVELELDTSDRDKDLPPHRHAGDLLEGRPLLNPVLQVLTYRWPVHRLSPRFKPVQAPAEPTFLLVYRAPELDVRFTVINAATARLLTLLQENPGLTGHELLGRLAAEWPEANAGALHAYGASLLADLRAQGVLLGVLI